MKLPECTRESILFYSASFVAAVSFVVVFVLIALEAYVRWTTNQGFTFLGGNSFGSLMIGAFALVIALLLTSGRKNCCCGMCSKHHA